MSATSATPAPEERPALDRNIHPEVDAICAKLGLKSSYVYELVIEPAQTTVHLFKGRDGTCEGPKYVIGSNSDPQSPNYGPRRFEPAEDGVFREVPPEDAPDDWGEPARETLTFAVLA